AEPILAAADLVAGAFRGGGKLLLCGNGGSAADCQHMAAEFTSRLSADFVRPALPAIAMTTDTSFLTAYANDFDFEGVFARQVEALGKPGDVLLAISTSGNSKNVIRAVETGKAMGLRTIVLMGSCANSAIDPTSPGPPFGFSPILPDTGSCADSPVEPTPPGPPFGSSPILPDTGSFANSAVDPTPLGPPLRRGGESEGGRMRLIRLADV